MTAAPIPVKTSLDRISPADLNYAPPAPAQLPGLGAVEEWLIAAGKARQLAELLVRGAFVPDSYKPKAGAPEDAWETAVQNATGAILLAQQLGVDPITGLQQIVMVKGRPTMYAKFKVGLLAAHGHEVWDEEYGEETVTVAGRRAGWPDDRIVRITITMTQAKKAGWTSNDTYAKTPADMLWARAASRVCDRVAPDVLFGLPTFADEVDPGDAVEPARTPVGVTVVDGVEPTAGNAGRSLAALMRQSAPEPVMTGEQSERLAESLTPATEEPQRAPDPEPPAERANVTRPQLSQIAMLLGGRHGLNGPGSKEKRTRIVSGIVGRTLQTSQELTTDEAGQVIAYLENTDTKVLLDMADVVPQGPRPPVPPPNPALAATIDDLNHGDDPWDEPDRNGADQ